MQHKTGKRPFQLPIRLRLTIWTTLSLSLILLLFTTFLYVRVRRSLLDQVDAGLSLAANQALLNVDSKNGRLAFQSTNQNPATLHNLSDDFVIYLLAQDGTPLDVLTSDDEIPAFSQPPTGFSTQFDQGEAWRVYRQTLNSERPAGWVQVAQELDPVNSTLASLLGQMAWGVPLALLVAGLGGAFLASRALRPIHRITQTAQAINAGDLAQRIHYLGPDDEVGQLAQTFDTMLDRLEAAFLRERRFTGDAAHELRTPLAALKGQIGVSLSKPRSPTAYQETLQGLEEQVDRLIRLSNDLLFMARLDQGQFQPRMESIALDSFLAAIVDQIRPLAEAKSITLTTTTPANLTLHGDMDLLIRLLLNLLHNAIKYTPENGRVSLQSFAAADRVRITITDTGPGIAPEHLPRLFKRFYRVEADRARNLGDQNQGGTGLGLAIAQDIARIHKGTLSVQSELMQGTTFTLTMPDGNAS